VTVAHEMPGISVFSNDDGGRIGLKYQTFTRGLEPFDSTWAILDLTPRCRSEGPERTATVVLDDRRS
jgi:predicted dithiol-disulfide oxidoreductase (DUF899 family)